MKWQLAWHRLTHWEYWPFSLFYLPIYLYFTYLSIRHRSFFFFTASNPHIEFGGMLGEKKSEIFAQIPTPYIPKTALIKAGDTSLAKETAYTTGFPLIVKPDIGERGKLVEKVRTEEDLVKYVEKCPVNFLIQELVDLPIELGVFYVRNPNEAEGHITSIVEKRFLNVDGDGEKTIGDLLRGQKRALLQVDFNHPRLRDILHLKPKKGEKVTIESIGNHSRGTTFLNRNKKITKELNAAFNKLSKQIPDFYFGRFDIKCKSYELLEKLEEFKILELNGAGSEPGHIYQPGYSIFKAYKDIIFHFKWLSTISQVNRKKGVAYWSFRDGMKKLAEIRRYNRMIESAL